MTDPTPPPTREQMIAWCKDVDVNRDMLEAIAAALSGGSVLPPAAPDLAALLKE